jgi:hypothetical protein
MRQGAQGKWLFHLPYTSEDHDGALIFTYYLFLGRLSALLGLPLILTYHLARVVNSLVLLTVAWVFVSLWGLERSTHRIAFLLIGLSSGLGWLTVPFDILAPDLWVPEGITFYAIFANPHFPLAIALMLLTFAFVMVPLQAEREEGPPGAWSSMGRGSILAGLSSLLLGIVQPFCVITVYTVLGGYFFLRLLKERRPPWPEILKGGVAGAVTAPVIAYDYYVYTFNPVLHAWSKQNITPSPPLWEYAIAYGFVLALAAGGAVLALRRRSKADLFLLTWVIVNGLLLYAPFSLQRRLVTGLHVPLCVLAAMALSRYVLPRFPPSRRTVVLGALIVLTLPSNLFVLLASMAGAAQHDSRLYLYKDEAEAMNWLEENTQPTDLILASPEVGLFIPAWAGNRVLYGHPFETIQAEEKKKLVEAFFREGIGGQAEREINRFYRPAYLFYGPREREMGKLEHEMPTIVYQNESVTIMDFPASPYNSRSGSGGNK